MFKTKYTEQVRISSKDLIWLKKNKPKGKSMASFLEEILRECKLNRKV